MNSQSYYRTLEPSNPVLYESKRNVRKSKYYAKKERGRSSNSSIDLVNNPYYLLGLPNEIRCLRDLIQYGYNYKGDKINIERLRQSLPVLEEINEMIGMEQLKNKVVDLVLYFIQNMFDKNEDYLHTVICGPPGTGKTHVSKLIAQLYADLGILKTNEFHIIQRTDLIGRYLGHTAAKTKETLEHCLGGVMFIDEAYALAPNKQGGDTDSFSKEALDVLNEFLSVHKNDFVCIISGYEDELERTIFSINKGLKRRFAWKFVIDDYTSEQFVELFHSMANRIGWTVSKNAIEPDFFKKNKSLFPYFGGDLETFITKCKFIHIRRIFGKESPNKIIEKEDIIQALEEHKEHRAEKEDKYKEYHQHIYM